MSKWSSRTSDQFIWLVTQQWAMFETHVVVHTLGRVPFSFSLHFPRACIFTRYEMEPFGLFVFFSFFILTDTGRIKVLPSFHWLKTDSARKTWSTTFTELISGVVTSLTEVSLRAKFHTHLSLSFTQSLIPTAAIQMFNGLSSTDSF